MLLILTNVDIRAVGPNIWNAWKCGLLDELYYRALEEMEMTAGSRPSAATMRVEQAKAKLRARLADWDDETREAYIARGYSDYWLAFNTDEHVRHFETDARRRAARQAAACRGAIAPVARRHRGDHLCARPSRTVRPDRRRHGAVRRLHRRRQGGDARQQHGARRLPHPGPGRTAVRQRRPRWSG